MGELIYLLLRRYRTLLLFATLLIQLNSVFADIDDLKLFVTGLNQQPAAVIEPELPSLNLGATDYAPPLENNIFDAVRNSNELSSQPSRQQYNLKQLQMVGYMRYANSDYAFLKTPFATIKVKVGDNVEQGKVIRITSSSTLISATEIEGDKSYKGKVFLELDPKTSPPLSKLRLK